MVTPGGGGPGKTASPGVVGSAGGGSIGGGIGTGGVGLGTAGAAWNVVANLVGSGQTIIPGIVKIPSLNLLGVSEKSENVQKDDMGHIH